MYFVVGDAEKLYEFHRANGVDVVEAPQDRPYEVPDYRSEISPGIMSTLDVACAARCPANAW